MGIAAFVISLLALLISFFSWISSNKYSRINLLHTVQELMLQKAKDCNLLDEKAWKEAIHPQERFPQFRNAPVISEIIISFQLLDNILDSYSLKEKETFFLKQFWTQLSTSIRSNLMDLKDLENYHETIQQQIKDIQKKFKSFF